MRFCVHFLDVTYTDQDANGAAASDNGHNSDGSVSGEDEQESQSNKRARLSLSQGLAQQVRRITSNLTASALRVHRFVFCCVNCEL